MRLGEPGPRAGGKEAGFTQVAFLIGNATAVVDLKLPSATVADDEPSMLLEGKGVILGEFDYLRTGK